jgi:hypothetical protein
MQLFVYHTDVPLIQSLYQVLPIETGSTVLSNPTLVAGGLEQDLILMSYNGTGQAFIAPKQP